MPRIVFFDDGDVLARTDCQRRVHPPRKHRANPLMEPEMPWEERRIAFEWPTVMYDADDGIWKAWYESSVGETDFGCYATSEDGLRWERPELGLVSFQGSKKNNIFRRGRIRKWRAICINVIKRAPGDWHMYYWDAMTPTRNQGVIYFTSADGIRWKQHKTNPVVQAPVDRTQSGGVEDVLRVSYDRVEKQFLLTQRTQPMERLDKPLLQDVVPVGFTQRRVSLATSKDGVHFTKLREVLIPELNDPPDVQFYALSAFRHDDRYLGLLQTFRTDKPCIDVELAHARTVDSWHRVQANTRYIPNGRPPAPDCGLIHPISDPVRIGDQLYIYYWGTTNDHRRGTINDLPMRNVLNLAVADARRMVSMRAGNSNGGLLLKPVRFGRNPRVLLNANPHGGHIKVALRDAETFAEIRGFAREDALPITKDARDEPAAWKGNPALAALAGRKVVAQVMMDRAELFDITLG